jgi:predicted alpha/beta-hydrolase family hydrolase
MKSTDLVLQLPSGTVSGMLDLPDAPRAILVLAHGAGAGMRHPFLERVARELAERGIGTLRYQFPYMEEGRSRTDPPAVAAATVRVAVGEAARRQPGVPLLAGGKSFGGRMTSTAASETALPSVRGLVFLGFPLHPAQRPSVARAEHLVRVTVPMLFLQGTRDDLADLGLMRQVCEDLGSRATLHVVEGGDHSFAVLKRTGRGPNQVFGELADAIAGFAAELG